MPNHKIFLSLCQHINNSQKLPYDGILKLEAMPVYASTVNGERTYYYRFTCGKCSKTTNWIPETIKVEYTLEKRIFVEKEVQNLLQTGLNKKLDDYIGIIKKGTKRGYYFNSPPFTNAEYKYNLKSTCPYCGQKAKIKSSIRNSIVIFGLIGFIIGTIGSLIMIFRAPSGSINSFQNLLPEIIFYVATIFIGCMVGYFVGRKNERKGIIHTNVEYRW